jgi:hypothetical protein
MRQVDGSSLLGQGDPRSAEIGILYVEAEDSRQEILTAINAQDLQGRKQIAIVLPERGKAFRQPAEFDSLKDMRRDLKAQLIFIKPAGPGPAQFARQRRFLVYSSLENFRMALHDESWLNPRAKAAPAGDEKKPIPARSQAISSSPAPIKPVMPETNQALQAMSPPATKNLKVFYCYAHEDQELRNKLDSYLRDLKRSYHLETWFDRQIKPGENWEETIEKQLKEADLILLLVSPDFIASDYCYNKEMQHALMRHTKGETKIIPIILRPVYWKSNPFTALQMLPKDAQAVTLWSNIDSAFYDIALGIERVIEELLLSRKAIGNQQ